MAARKLRAFVETLETRNLLCGDTAATVAFSQPSFDVSENGESIGPEIAITRSCGEGTATVGLRVEHGTAARRDIVSYAGEDFEDQNFQVQFEEGETSKTIPVAAMSSEELAAVLRNSSATAESHTDPNSIVTLLDDDVFEPTETFSVQITSVVGNNLTPQGQIGTQINIIDDAQKSVVLNHTDGTTDVMADGAVDTIATSLNFQPSGSVVVKPNFDESVFVVTPEQLEFTAADWNTEKFFTVEGLREADAAQLTVSVDAERTNEADRDAESAIFEFSIGSHVEFEQVSPTLSVANINPDPKTAGLNPRNFAVAGDYLYFTSDAGSAPNVSLWKSNGTTEGTSVVAQLEGPPTQIVGTDEQLFFLIDDQLWTLGDNDMPELLGPNNGRINGIEAQASAAEDENEGSVRRRIEFGFNGQRFLSLIHI